MKYWLCNETEKFELFYQNETKKKLNGNNTFVSPILCKGEKQYIQLVLFDNEDEYALIVSNEAYLCVEGNYSIYRLSVSAEDVAAKIYIERFIDCEDGRKYNDCISDETYLFVDNRKKIAIVLIELSLTNKDTQEGEKRGYIEVYKRNTFEDEVLVKQIPFSFEALNFEIIEPKNGEFYLDLWQHNCNVARKFQVENYSNEHFSLLDSYIKMLGELGQRSISIIASDAPWGNAFPFNERNGLSDLYEYNIFSVTRIKNGEFSVDFKAFEKYMALCEKYGIDEEIEVFGLLNILHCEDDGFENIVVDYCDNIRVRYFDEVSRTYKYMRTKKEIDEYITLLYDYFIKNKLIDKVRIASDEPIDTTLFLERLNHVKDLCPQFKFKISLFDKDIIAKLAGECDIAVTLQAIPEFSNEITKKLRETDKKFLFYVCCGPRHPNTFIKSNLLETRFLPLFVRYLGLDGFLRWNYTVWPNDPINCLTYKPYILPSGDANFVYPSKNAGLLLSLRYIQLRRGIDDYNLLARLDDEEAKLLLEKYIIKEKNHANFYLPYATAEDCYSINYADYCALRRSLIRRLKK